MNASEATSARDKTGQLGFVNRRAEWFWTLREALDPKNGEDLALPPDRELLADLCSARYKVTVRGIQIESKEDIMKRIGRSPDKGDSLCDAVLAGKYLFLHEATVLALNGREERRAKEAVRRTALLFGPEGKLNDLSALALLLMLGERDRALLEGLGGGEAALPSDSMGVISFSMDYSCGSAGSRIFSCRGVG